jgi:NADH:ubiquinone oxidoreductase subunit D
MLFSELVRIYSHMSSLIFIADEARLESMSWSILREQEKLSQLFAKYNGSRVLAGVYSIGGVDQDLPIGWGSLCQSTLKSIKKTILVFSKQTTRSRQWMNRMGLSPLNAKLALDWGITGPMLRACGVNYDLRKTIGHYFYKDIEFEIPLGINGDCYDRVLVKVEEIYQSSKICEQLIDNLPAGDHHLFNSLNASQSDHPQQLIAKNLRFLTGPNLKTGIHEASLESPSGHLSVTTHVDSQNKSSRVRLRTPGFPLSQLYPALARGLSLEQSMTALSSLHLRSSEVDR